jgi:uncharacterized protein (UPF0276 family)
MTTTAPSSSRFGLPDLGIGVGLRVPHYAKIFEDTPPVDWFEIISENFMVEGGRPIENLERALASYRLVQHGVSMSIGSANPLDWDYLSKLKRLVKKTGTPWLSDHLCWTGADEHNLHDLLPMPMTLDAAKYVAERARIVQDFLEVRFALENVSSYLTYTSSVMTEWQFVSEVVERADVGLMLDVNNVYVSSENHGFDPLEYLAGVPMDRVVQIHLAGHTRMEKYILDTHSGHVTDAVWQLYAFAIEKAGNVPTLIEWDDEIPSFDILMAEVEKARDTRAVSLATRRAGLDGAEARA